MVDNPDTPLAVSDLVFYDAMETGFSRPASPEFAPEFLNLKGDVAATAEFIRVCARGSERSISPCSFAARVTEYSAPPLWRTF